MIKNIPALKMVLEIRTLDLYWPKPHMQQMQFPQQSQLSFDNYIAAVLENSEDICLELNFILSANSISDFYSEATLTAFDILPGQATDVEMWYDQDTGQFVGFQLFEFEKILYQPYNHDYNSHRYESQRRSLKQGERLIGL